MYVFMYGRISPSSMHLGPTYFFVLGKKERSSDRD